MKVVPNPKIYTNLEKMRVYIYINNLNKVEKNFKISFNILKVLNFCKKLFASIFSIFLNMRLRLMVNIYILH